LNGFILEDAQGDLNLIESDKRILFICTGRKNDQINQLIMNLIQKKINKVINQTSLSNYS
jgi:hypothetical protein